MDIIKEIPGYKVILKAVLKNQIQQLVEQLSSQADEESVILTANVSDGSLSHLGSQSGKSFLQDHEDIKSQFLGFCLKRHHRMEQEKKAESFDKPQPRFTSSLGITDTSLARNSCSGAGSFGTAWTSPGKSPVRGIESRTQGLRHEPYRKGRGGNRNNIPSSHKPFTSNTNISGTDTPGEDIHISNIPRTFANNVPNRTTQSLSSSEQSATNSQVKVHCNDSPVTVNIKTEPVLNEPESVPVNATNSRDISVNAVDGSINQGDDDVHSKDNRLKSGLNSENQPLNADQFDQSESIEGANMVDTQSETNMDDFQGDINSSLSGNEDISVKTELNYGSEALEISGNNTVSEDSWGEEMSNTSMDMPFNASTSRNTPESQVSYSLALCNQCHVSNDDQQLHCGDATHMTCNGVEFIPYCHQISTDPKVQMNGICSCERFCFSDSDCASGCGSSGRFRGVCQDAYLNSVEKICVCKRA